MPSRLTGRIAFVIGLAVVLLFAVTTVVPPTMQVVAAVLSLPIGATLVATVVTTPR